MDLKQQGLCMSMILTRCVGPLVRKSAFCKGGAASLRLAIVYSLLAYIHSGIARLSVACTHGMF